MGNGGGAGVGNSGTANQLRTFPETSAGGLSRRSGTIEFYTRVRALVDRTSGWVDLGANRGRFREGTVASRRDRQHLQSGVGRLIGLDVDDAVLETASVDNAHVITPGKPSPLDGGTIDVVVPDFTLRARRGFGKGVRRTRPDRAATRVDLRAYRWGVIALPARPVPNHLHDRVLPGSSRTSSPATPSRRSIDSTRRGLVSPVRLT